MNQENNKANFTEGSILRKLLMFSFPIILALFLQAAYSAVDLIVVGWFGSNADTSGVSTGGQLMHSLTQVIAGFSMATTVLLGHKLGEKKNEECGKIIGTSSFIFIALSIFVTIIMLLLAKPFCNVMNAPEEAFNETLSYVRICCAGLLFIVAYNVLGSICRGLGDSKSPLITVIISAILNIILDLLLCAVFKMGASGAAIATVASQGISCIIMLIVLLRGNKYNIEIKKSDLIPDKTIAISVLKLGAPIALQDGLVGVSFLFIMAIVNQFGVEASAGVGCAQKVCSFIMLIPSAFSQALSAFVAQNVGAKLHERAKKALFYGIGTSFACAIVLFYFSFFQGAILARVFSKSLEVQLQAASYLKAYAIDTFLTSFMFCMMGYFNGYGKTRFVMIQGVCTAFLIRIPVSYFMSRLENTSLFLIGLATPCCTFTQIIIFVTYFIIMQKKMKKEQEMNLNIA